MSRLVIALVTLLGLAAGTVVAGYLLLAGSSDRLAALAPARTAAYVNVYLEPSPEQQMNLAGLIGRLPGFADAASLETKVDQVLDNLFAGAGIDYATELQPWLGDQVALATWPGDDLLTAPEAVVIAAIRDREAADAVVEDLLGGDDAAFAPETYEGVEVHVSASVTYAFVDDTLVVGPTLTGIQAVIDVAGGASSLAGASEFQAAMSRVPADHLASAFIDTRALLTAVGGTDDAGGSAAASAALLAETDGLRLSGSIPTDGPAGAPSGSVTSTLVDWMPADALASVVTFGLPATLEDAESALGGTDAGGEALGLLDTLRALVAFGLGLDLDADLLPLLDAEAGISITAIEDGLPSGQLLLRPADGADAEAALDTIADRLVAAGGQSRTETADDVEITIVSLADIGEVSYAVVEGVAILGLAPGDVIAALDAHTSGSSLSGSDNYQQAFEVAGARSGTEAYVNVGALSELGVLDELLTGLPDDARDILSQLGAFAITVPSRADAIEIHAALTILEPSAE